MVSLRSAPEAPAAAGYGAETEMAFDTTADSGAVLNQKVIADGATSPLLTLYGEGAADWLAEHGEALGDGLWRVSVEDVNALPDTLELVAEDGVQQPVDGMLILTLGTTEATP